MEGDRHAADDALRGLRLEIERRRAELADLESRNGGPRDQLRVELWVRRAELASLQRAEDILERACAEVPGRCDRWAVGSPCSGLVHERVCSRCGEKWRRCETHGGIHSAAAAVKRHNREHGGPDVWDPTADNARRLQSRGATVPVGGVSPSPVARGGDEQEGEGPEGDLDQDQPTDSDGHQGRPSTGPAVIVRRRSGAPVDR